MALHFILGSSGSGKSNYIYEHITQWSEKEPDQLFFVVVPEQFTMQTQRELVRCQKNHGIMNIDVVSFQRLAYRVFDELGLNKMKVLEETGKSFVLRKVAEDKKEQLQMLRPNRKKAGYINEVKSVISELAQYRISAEQLNGLIENESLPAPFRYRMSDIQVMYQGFSEYLKGEYITAEEILEVLAENAGTSALLKDCVLVLDGFTGFTPVQYALLERLMEYAKDIYIAVTIDEGEEPFICEGMQELFYMSKKTIRTMSEIAAKHHVAIAEAVRLTHGSKSRFHQAKPLEWLEQNLFREKAGKYPASDHILPAKPYSADSAEKQPEAQISGQNVNQYIFLRSLPDPRQELQYLAGEIRRLVREEGCRYKDIAIVCGDVEMYGNYVPEIFESFEIPYFIDKKNSISFHPMTEMIKAALSVVEQDFSYESVMAYLRCGLSGIRTEGIDLLENYLLANRIRGFSKWQEKWVRVVGTRNTEELEQVNEIRLQICEQFGAFFSVLKKKDNRVLEKTVALYRFIVELNVQQQLEDRRVELEKTGRTALAREYDQMYRIVMDLLNKLTQLLAEEQMELHEYREILEAGFAASFVGIVPPGYDQVLIGDIERTRLPDIKVLFLAGVNDGLIPKSEKGGGLISQQEWELFSEYGMELAPGAREKSFIQKFYLYLNLTKPSEKLYVTWFRTSGDGKETRKSYLVGTLLHMFPELRTVKVEAVSGIEQLVTPKSSRRFLINGIHQAKTGTVSPEFLALLDWYRNQESWSKKVEELLDAAFYTYEQQFMSREVSRELYGTVLENSVTRLERFAACAYAHFMAYGIGVKERQLGEFAPVDMGSLFHEALELYSVKMEEAGYHWFDVPGEKQEQMAEEAVRETVEEAGYLLYQDARTAYTVQRILRILKKTIETISTQISQSSFTPEGYEVSFSFAQDLESVNFTLSEEEKMKLRGRIDRMDTRHEENRIYVKVVDYKSGNTQFSLVSLYHGLQLQLVVYLNAAVEILKRKYPGKDVLPAGMFYYHIDDPVVDAKGNEPEEEIKKQVLEQLKLNGVGLDEPDESVSRKSQKAEKDEMTVLSDYANAKIRDIGAKICHGDIQVNPYMLKDRTGCDYCPYHSICGFDGKVPGYKYRRLADEKDKDIILEKMREENQ